MNVLVTGGAGYIGSTTASALADAGHRPILLDSLVRGQLAFTQGRVFYQGDIGDRALLSRIFCEQGGIGAVVHCAALIQVPESVSAPYLYYQENVAKSLVLFQTLAELGVSRVIFSSSASVYAPSASFVADESSPLAPASPYARTKMVMELALEDICGATSLRGLSLRYFNPIGADPAMRTGPHVRDPSHVLGRLVDTALGKIPCFEITGTQWPTRDGSGLRDYVHVWDLARAHVAALEEFDRICIPGRGARHRVINLGTGQGVTVRELVAAFEGAFGRPVPKRDAPPRPGDVAGTCASAELARSLLGWRAELSLEQAIGDALRWAKGWEQPLEGAEARSMTGKPDSLLLSNVPRPG